MTTVADRWRGVLLMALCLLWSATAHAQVFVNDTFTDTAGDLVTSAHTGETGATWTKSTAAGYTGGDLLITDQNRARQNNGGATLLYASGTGTTAEYDITCVINVQTVIAGGNTGCGGRASTNAETGYFVLYEVAATDWVLWEVIGGVYTNLASCDMTLSAGDYTIALVLRNASKSFTISGNGSCSPAAHTATNDITATGRVAILSANHVNSNTTGLHVDSITASNPSTGGAAHSLFMRGVSD